MYHNCAHCMLGNSSPSYSSPKTFKNNNPKTSKRQSSSSTCSPPREIRSTKTKETSTNYATLDTIDHFRSFSLYIYIKNIHNEVITPQSFGKQTRQATREC